MNKQGKVKANEKKKVLVLNILARHILNLWDLPCIEDANIKFDYHNNWAERNLIENEYPPKKKNLAWYFYPGVDVMSQRQCSNQNCK